MANADAAPLPAPDLWFKTRSCRELQLDRPLVKLAADVSSFYNITPDEALDLVVNPPETVDFRERPEEARRFIGVFEIQDAATGKAIEPGVFHANRVTGECRAYACKAAEYGLAPKDADRFIRDEDGRPTGLATVTFHRDIRFVPRTEIPA